MFASREDMEDAVSNVDGTEMRNMRGACVVKVIPQSEGRGRSRSRCVNRSTTPDAVIHTLCLSFRNCAVGSSAYDAFHQAQPDCVEMCRST